MLDHILVTLDGSELSEKALDYATQIVAPGAKITLATVVDIPDISAYSLYPMSVSMEYYDQAVTQAETGAVQYIEGEADKLREKGYQVDTYVGMGIAADIIVQVADDLKVNAIVMCTHGRSGINRWLFGSVTQRVLSAMVCPVFVVPGQEQAPLNKPTNAAVKAGE
jgi:nucleotide-binding universal stress UspA family protein